jgi:hypothetical protein
MEKLFIFIATTIGSAVGWWLGSMIGWTSAFVLSMVGFGLGMYLGSKITRDYF